MLTQSLKNLWAKIEVVLIIFALIGGEDIRWQPLDKLTTAVTYLAVPVIVLPHWKRMFYVATRNVPLLLLYAFVFCSLFWSASPDRTTTLIRTLLPRTLLGIYLATRFNLKEQMHLLAWTFGLSALGCFLMNRVAGVAWMGFYLHKNYLSRMMAVGSMLFIFLGIDNPKRWRLYALLASFALFMLIRSTGKTALVLYILVLCLLPLYWLVKRNYKFQVAILSIGILAVGITTITIINNFEFLVVDVLGKSLTLNGRTQIWSYFIERGLTRPWLGYGYSAFWAVPEERYGVAINTWYATKESARALLYDGIGHAHSGWIDLFLSLGIIGVILFSISFLNLLWNSVQLVVITKKLEYFWILSFITFFVILNITITNTILSSRHLFWMMYVSMALSTSLELERLRRPYRAREFSEFSTDAGTVS